ncbi:hypothetical protein F5Y18DRAFT_428946 [Xylariaceae sp. FL1019]|nr:hypothetical protein F5Y18DRAFT_428946 [Xylariaceae sp. FL1019]
MTKTFSVSFLALSLVIAPQALAGDLRVQNHCSFAIWCAGAKNDGTAEASHQIGSGGSYTSSKPANNDNIGAVLKCGTDSRLAHPYQMEMAVQNGVSYLDLSAIDGDPFLSYHRHAEIPGTSCVLDCLAGSTDCEWPRLVTCKGQDDATLFLC